MSEFKLYNYFRSSASFRIRIALHFKGIPFEYHPVHLLNKGGEQFTAEYKQLNSASEVPTLVHNGYSLSQSMAILEYLDQISPALRLIPADAKLGGKVRQFCEDINSGGQPLLNLKVMKYLGELGLTPEQQQKWQQRWVTASLATLEAGTEAKGPYAFGTDVTAADAFLVPHLFACRRFGGQIENYPKLAKIEKACLLLEVFRLAHPHNQIDTPEELRGQF